MSSTVNSQRLDSSSVAGGQASSVRITEIDVSRPSRALAVLRLSDLVLVLGCGFGALGVLPDVVASAASGKWLDLLIQVAIAAIFIFAAFTGWRHVGTIDPRVWRSYLWVFPLLALVTVLGLSSIHLSTDLFENVEALARLFGLLWIAGIAIPGFICVLLLRRMKIAPMDVPVTKLITQLIQRGGVSAPTVTHVHRPGLRRAIVYGVIGGAILLGTTFVPLPSDINQASTMMKVTQQLNLLAFFLIVRARRHFQVSADSLLAVDKRPPILFLRSFTDDERQHYGNSERALLDFSLETRLANHFQRFGPFIAVGSPKETLPEPGSRGS